MKRFCSKISLPLTVALLIGDTYSIICQPGDDDYCTRYLGKPAECYLWPSLFGDEYQCSELPSLKLTTGEEDRMVIPSKLKLGSEIPKSNYNDCFCNYCSKNTQSLGLCETQGTSNTCALVAATYQGQTDATIYRFCASDSQLNTLVTAL